MPFSTVPKARQSKSNFFFFKFDKCNKWRQSLADVKEPLQLQSAEEETNLKRTLSHWSNALHVRLVAHCLMDTHQ